MLKDGDASKTGHSPLSLWAHPQSFHPRTSRPPTPSCWREAGSCPEAGVADLWHHSTASGRLATNAPRNHRQDSIADRKTDRWRRLVRAHTRSNQYSHLNTPALNFLMFERFTAKEHFWRHVEVTRTTTTEYWPNAHNLTQLCDNNLTVQEVCNHSPEAWI